MRAAQALRHARRRARMTQRDLAAKTGVPQSAIARIESGRVIPRVDTLDRLLRACGRSLEVAPVLGEGVDRTLIAHALKLSPRERLDRAAEAADALEPFIGAARR